MTETSKEKPPGAAKGIAGVLLEPYYLIFGPAVQCPDCDVSWRGYYSQHMEYCHFCGEELVHG